ncbi:MAG: DNA-3-methyladenine glycosylase 2 family protein [Candidatus Bathyarchaeota archaeon]|nr:DNA-3-methyladenine glycosylase 2 family protein [Candidatus Bathyarchaeota archaeon]
MLDEESLHRAADELAERDPHLRAVIEKHGYPPLWAREPGFPTLVKIILEQQVSLSSAQAAYDKLLDQINPLTPEEFLTLDDAELKQIGFSRQKTRYCRILADSILCGELDLAELVKQSDEEVSETLTALKGIGPWTAGVYLLMVLRRPDIWPRGDIALLTSMQEVKQLDTRPDNDVAAEIADAWRPWRSVAARILWHNYLSERAAKTDFSGR